MKSASKNVVKIVKKEKAGNNLAFEGKLMLAERKQNRGINKTWNS